MKRRYELRFGLLGPPALYDRQPSGISYEPSADPRVGPDGGPGTYDTAPDGAADTQPSVIGSPKMRALLAALLLEAGRVVSTESLKDALWGGAPPVSARASLHNHVTRLRRLLDDPERLRTVAPGYLLRVDQGELDVHVFDARVVAARAAHAREDWRTVVCAATSALALWRGVPLGGLAADLGGYALAQRLEEARLLLLEWRYDAELALGGTRLADIVPELAALVAEHPLREAYHRRLMLALHRTGRQAEALAVHRDLRARLVEELGVEPGPAVREAHLEVLRDLPAPERGETGAPAGAPSHGHAYAPADSGPATRGARVPVEGGRPPAPYPALRNPSAASAGRRERRRLTAAAPPPPGGRRAAAGRTRGRPGSRRPPRPRPPSPPSSRPRRRTSPAGPPSGTTCGRPSPPGAADWP